MGNKTKIFIVYLIFLFLIIVLGCNPIKKAEKTVLNNKESSERVFRELEKTRPCANDTTVISISDTLYKTDTAIDYKVDTINNVVTLTEKGKIIYKTKTITETKTAFIVDNRRLAIMADSVRFYKVSLQDSINTSKKWRSRFWWVILGLVAYIGIKRLFLTYINKII
jgi:ABC-type transport system involved in multi-copper enzyme maturation permease subunit